MPKNPLANVKISTCENDTGEFRWSCFINPSLSLYGGLKPACRQTAFQIC